MDKQEILKHLKDKKWYQNHIIDLGCAEAAMFGPFGKKDDAVETICYGKRNSWKSRWAAMEFFRYGMMMCDGSEAERYMRIFLDLYAGKKIGSDGEPERKKTQ